MQKAIVGKKVKMTQIWDSQDRASAATILSIEPCRVVRLKTPETDGYSALQVTYGEVDLNRLNKPQLGHFEAAGVEPGKKLLELRLEDISTYDVGSEIGVDTFEEGEMVDVTSVSKGKGFTGVMKRYGFAGGPASHGAQKVHRKPGSIGQCATPSRVFRGKKMPGRSGAEKVTVLNLEVLKADSSEGLIWIKGSVPGPRGATVIVRNAVKLPVGVGS